MKSGPRLEGMEREPKSNFFFRPLCLRRMNLSQLCCSCQCPENQAGGKELSGACFRVWVLSLHSFLPEICQAVGPEAKFRSWLGFPVNSCPAPQRRSTGEGRSVPLTGRSFWPFRLGPSAFGWLPLGVEIQADQR